MKLSERKKAIANAVAVAASNVMVPAAVRVGLAAMAEELDELRARLDNVILADRYSKMHKLQTSEEEEADEN